MNDADMMSAVQDNTVNLFAWILKDQSKNQPFKKYIAS